MRSNLFYIAATEVEYWTYCHWFARIIICSVVRGVYSLVFNLNFCLDILGCWDIYFADFFVFKWLFKTLRLDKTIFNHILDLLVCCISLTFFLRCSWLLTLLRWKAETHLQHMMCELDVCRGFESYRRQSLEVR